MSCAACNIEQDLAIGAVETEVAAQNLSLVDIIIENLQLKVHNVHVRFEHPLPSPLALGITLKRFTISATDADWQPRSRVSLRMGPIADSCLLDTYRHSRAWQTSLST